MLNGFGKLSLTAGFGRLSLTISVTLSLSKGERIGFVFFCVF